MDTITELTGIKETLERMEIEIRTLKQVVDEVLERLEEELT